jgi:hypothetical protein
MPDPSYADAALDEEENLYLFKGPNQDALIFRKQ